LTTWAKYTYKQTENKKDVELRSVESTERNVFTARYQKRSSIAAFLSLCRVAGSERCRDIKTVSFPSNCHNQHSAASFSWTID